MASSPLGRPQTPPNRGKEIAASDDEGSDSGFSDNSLEDLSTLLGGPRPRAAPRHADQLLATPQAKRAAHTTTLHRSPLTIIPKHRFDLKALAKDARRDTALQASSLRAQEAVRERTAPSTPGTGGALPASQSVLSDIVSSERGRDAQKVLRAVQRADPGHQELRYCFFQADFDAPAATKPPPEAMQSPWSLLTKGNQRVREQNLISGVPFNVVGSQGGMPEPIFLWVLEEICVAKSTVARTELCNLILICPDQIASLFTPNLLKSIWVRLGVDDVSLERGKISVSKDISPALPLETRRYLLQSLLRMAMDRLIIANVDIDSQFEDTFKAIIKTIPPEEWDSFCHDTCALLQSNFSSQCIRINALLCLPTSPPRAHDLRRRLAVTFLFHDASLARRAPEEVVTLPTIIDRLAQPEFQVGPATEFAELRAAILILDMAVDDGSVIAFAPDDDTDAEDEFNADVDELAARLNEIWRRTNDTGMKLARTEAKSVVEWVQKRVTHTVRTRRKRAKSIFDVPGQEKKQKKDLPRQQEFMKSFFRKKAPSPKLAPKQEPEPKREPEPEPEHEPEPKPELEEIVLDSIVVRGG
ncbi:hypothetical protein LMH87_002325 [Akanthomyces muscarius]|uniref:Uncharacterized protein n=1 Tax=Akanthomyces muscarius TaxID=2231603 RepID=A0A9W8Q6L8_AKAMU|nr:hypothetical protein LMH87_002325 [Akanthomyces muscarius]KAJ4147823.1 hypothetical protein LMH87_002325 [Akanthomyces muscarius]